MANTVAAMKSAKPLSGNRYLMWAEACITCLQPYPHGQEVPVHIAPNTFRWWGQGLVSSIPENHANIVKQHCWTQTSRPETKVGVVQHSWFPCIPTNEIIFTSNETPNKSHSSSVCITRCKPAIVRLCTRYLRQSCACGFWDSTTSRSFSARSVSICSLSESPGWCLVGASQNIAHTLRFVTSVLHRLTPPW